MSYVELHARTAFSFLRGGSYPQEITEIAANKNLSAVAVCDRDGVYGSAIFKKSGRRARYSLDCWRRDHIGG
jgi:error-prone DNA polymerase